MSILTGIEFDARVGDVAGQLIEAMAPSREEGLAQVIPFLRETLEAMDASDIEDMGLESLASFFYQSLRDLGPLDHDNTATVDAILSAAQEQIDRDARAAAVDTFTLDVDVPYPDDDPRLQASSATTAGAFLTRRDDRLAQSLATSLAEALLESIATGQDDLVNTLGAIDEVIRSAWSERAEEQYWVLTASAWMARSRNAGIASALQDAGLERARIAAELDARTTPLCQFLHGKVILVESAIATEAGLVTPSSTSAWPRMTNEAPADSDTPDADATPHIYLPTNPPTLVAARSEPVDPDGLAFDMGSYTQYISDEQLAQTLGPPPYHFLCRSILVPEEYEDILEFRADITYATPPTNE